MARLSSSSQGVTKTIDPRSAGKAGFVQAYAGATAPSGWKVCDGAVLQQADYPQLYAALGSTWDAFAHPVDGAPTVGAGQFALPNLKGLYLAGAGDNGASNFAAGTYYSDTFQLHSHAIRGGTGSGATTRVAADPNNSSSYAMTNTDPEGSAETRPKTAPITYIIKLYDDSTTAVSVSVAEATADTAGVVKAPKIISSNGSTPTQNIGGWFNVTSIALTEGTWAISANQKFQGVSGSQASTKYMAISEYSGATTTDHVQGISLFAVDLLTNNNEYPTINGTRYLTVGAGGTTVYMKVQDSVGTVHDGPYGIQAVRL